MGDLRGDVAAAGVVERGLVLELGAARVDRTMQLAIRRASVYVAT